MRVLLTGMPGVGKSTLVAELKHRGYHAYDADDDGFSTPRGPGSSGVWGWRTEAVQELFAAHQGTLLFFAGCSDEQAHFRFDLRVLLSVPEATLIQRLQSRSTNTFGKAPGELEQVLRNLHEIEPLLRRTADLELDATAGTAVLADSVLAAVSNFRSG